MIRILPELLEYTAAAFPDKAAYTDPSRTLTFSETLEESRRIAGGLITRGLFKAPIALFIGKSVSCVTAVFGTAMSGNYYTVIDTDMPQERLRIIMNTLQPETVLTVHALHEQAKVLFRNIPILCCEDLVSESYEPEAVRACMRRVQPADLLFVLFTSGSTGVPKGVIATHGAIMNYISCWDTVFEFSADDILLSQVPFYFVMSVLDLFAPAAFGAHTHIVPSLYYAFPPALLKYIENNRVTSLVWVTSALTLLAEMDAFSLSDLSSVKKVLFGGEVMPPRILERWLEHVPGAFYVNGYGSTELLDGGVFYRVDRHFEENETLPIGKPFPHMDIFLLDEDDRLVTEEGIVGEICARGSSVSIGYYRDPDRTAEVFVQNPLNTLYEEKIYRTGDLAKYNSRGEMLYAGRKDFQIKHMGHRVELGEIEAAALTDGVSEAACVYNAEARRILLYYTGSVEEKELGYILRDKLPDYMLPWKQIKLQEMPRNAHGKTDRTALRAMS